jgi:hypothetical protein
MKVIALNTEIERIQAGEINAACFICFAFKFWLLISSGIIVYFSDV